jgi:hypothetical protein
MAALSPEKVYLVASAALALASAAVCGTFIWRHAHAPQTAVAQVEFSDTPYAATVADAAIVKTDTWTSPSSQTRGRDWIYDTFTPPEIFYNARSKHFTVKPPASMTEEGVLEEAFGVELVTVRPEPFRLQLIGYLGGEGTWRGTFEIVGTGEVFLGSAGRAVPKVGLTIKSLEVRTVDIKIPESMTTRQRVATAVVRDDKTGRDVTLTHRERHFTGGLSAFVAATGDEATREVRAGESFVLGDVTYRIEKILLSPVSIEISKDSPSLTQPDRRTLTPREADETAPADGTPSTQ